MFKNYFRCKTATFWERNKQGYSIICFNGFYYIFWSLFWLISVDFKESEVSIQKSVNSILFIRHRRQIRFPLLTEMRWQRGKWIPPFYSVPPTQWDGSSFTHIHFIIKLTLVNVYFLLGRTIYSTHYTVKNNGIQVTYTADAYRRLKFNRSIMCIKYIKKQAH